MSLKKLWGICKNLDAIIAGASLIALVALTFSGVVMRYFIQKPFVWLEEVQIWLFIWVTLFGGSMGFRSKSHVAIDIFVDMLPKPIQKIFNIAIYAVVVVCLGYFLSKGIQLVSQFIQTNKTTSVLSISSPMIYSAIPIGCVLMILNYSVMVWRETFGGGEVEDA